MCHRCQATVCPIEVLSLYELELPEFSCFSFFSFLFSSFFSSSPTSSSSLSRRSCFSRVLTRSFKSRISVNSCFFSVSADLSFFLDHRSLN